MRWKPVVTAPVWGRPATRDGARLAGDRRADVCVVGGGVAGLTIAYSLAEDGHEVVLLEAAEVGEGESHRTTAHLVSALDRGWSALLTMHGEAHARAAAASHGAAIDRIEEIVRTEGIECDFRRVDGYLSSEPRHDDGALADELEAAHRAGLADVARLDAMPAPLRMPGPCLRFPGQGRLHPARYLQGLAEAARRAGVTIATYARAVDIEGDGLLRVRTASGASVSANAVVVATNTPFSTRVAIHAKQAAYRTYAVALPIAPGAVPDALYWDMDEPFHYVRLHGGVLVVGGEDHKTGQDEDGPEVRFARLEAWARDRFPVDGPAGARWSGPVIETMDGLGFIGPLATGANVYVVSGDCGDGYTHATIAAMLLTDLVAGRASPWAATYDPGRIRVRALGTAAEENLNVAGQLTRWVTPGDVPDAAAVAPGTGAVVRSGLTPRAVYREPDGRTVEMSAVCPHLGCIVRWNAGEQSWDCPCHGSRFDAHGRVLSGPATRPLEPVDAGGAAAVK